MWPCFLLVRPRGTAAGAGIAEISFGPQPDSGRARVCLPSWHGKLGVRPAREMLAASSRPLSPRSTDHFTFDEQPLPLPSFRRTRESNGFQLPIAESLDDLKCAIGRASEPGRLHAWEERACGGGVRRAAWKA